MTQEIRQKVSEYRQQHRSVYIRAAEHFDTSYGYVLDITSGRRMPTKGKGKAIINWLAKELNIANTNN